MGEIVDYTGSELRLRLSTGKERNFPAEQVARVVSPRTDAQRAGDELFAARNFRGALAQYALALGSRQEQRGWVRRELTAQAIWCYRALGQTETAAQTFLQVLLPGDPLTPYFECIPLAWMPGQIDANLERAAATWLITSDSPVAMLIGASYMLNSPQRPTALDRLKRLSTDRDRRIAWLAQAQIWRTNLFQATEQQLLANLAAIDDCPESLRAGPYFLVGTALAKQRPTEASLALLRVPILYPRERQLASAALLAAGGILQRQEKSDDAARLYRELIDDYRGLPEAEEAQRRLSAGKAKP